MTVMPSNDKHLSQNDLSPDNRRAPELLDNNSSEWNISDVNRELDKFMANDAADDS